MIRRIPLAVCAFLVNGAAAHASPNPDTIQFLYRACQEELGSETPGFCLGYIEAASEIMATNGGERLKILPNDTEGRRYLTEFGLCPNPSIGASGAELIQAFLNWAKKHRDLWADHALVGVTLSLAATWSCRNSD